MLSKQLAACLFDGNSKCALLNQNEAWNLDKERAAYLNKLSKAKVFEDLTKVSRVLNFEQVDSNAAVKKEEDTVSCHGCVDNKFGLKIVEKKMFEVNASLTFTLFVKYFFLPISEIETEQLPEISTQQFYQNTK